jgi:TolB protein
MSRTLSRDIAGILVLCAFVCATAVLLFTSTVLAAFPGANGRIAFAQKPAFGQFDIYSVEPSGAGLAQLTDNPFNELSPAWSANGKRITYVRSVRRRYQVYTMSASGANQARLSVDRTIDSSPGFSPSGGRVVYAKDNLLFADATHPRRISVVTVRNDGTDERLVATGYVRGPQYSPSGEWIAFEGIPEGKNPDSYGIWLARPNGAALHRVTAPGPEHYDQFPDWRPDGQRILFSRCENAGSGCFGQIYSVRPDGSGLRAVSFTGIDDRATYSPDGHRIANVAGDPGGGDNCWDIYTFSQIGTNGRYVTDNCEDPSSGDLAWWPSWQPLPDG